MESAKREKAKRDFAEPCGPGTNVRLMILWLPSAHPIVSIDSHSTVAHRTGGRKCRAMRAYRPAVSVCAPTSAPPRDQCPVCHCVAGASMWPQSADAYAKELQLGD